LHEDRIHGLKVECVAGRRAADGERADERSRHGTRSARPRLRAMARGRAREVREDAATALHAEPFTARIHSLEEEARDRRRTVRLQPSARWRGANRC
jgi:hypothetical protein